jgi:hypothetical protein
MSDLDDVNDLLEGDAETQKEKLPAGTLYFMRETDYLTGQQFDYIKIGIVKGERDFAAREKEHKTGNPRSIKSIKEVSTDAVQTLETFMHNKFASNRVSSGEWFHLPGSQLENAIAIAEAQAAVLADSIVQIRTLGESSKAAHDKKPLDKTKELENVVFELLRLESLIAQNKSLREDLSKHLISIAGDDPKYEKLFKFSQTKDSTQFDGAALKKAHKDLYESFMTKESFSWSYKILVEAHHEETPPATLEGKSPTELHKDYLDAWSDNASLTWDLMVLESQLVNSIGEASGIDGLVQWKRTDRKSFDKKAFEDAHPDLITQFQKYVEAKKSVHVAEWVSYKTAI